IEFLGFTCYLVYFFFQAEDGIRDFHVTGVQTCALPICTSQSVTSSFMGCSLEHRSSMPSRCLTLTNSCNRLQSRRFGCPSDVGRSEERRVGKECRFRWCLAGEE